MNITKSIIEIFYAVKNEISENEDAEKEKEYEEHIEHEYLCLSNHISTIATTRAHLLLGLMSGGEKNLDFSPGENLDNKTETMDNISPKDLFEAADCFDIVARYGDGDMQLQSDSLRDIAEQRERLQNSGMRSYIDRSVPGDFSVGSWVIVKGLQSKAGAPLNGKLGYILSGPSEERYAVEFDGIEAKKIKGNNLDPVPIDDIDRGIVTCFNKEDQWSFIGEHVLGMPRSY